MDAAMIAAVTAAAVQIISQYLAGLAGKAAEGAASEVGKAAVSKAADLYATVQARFQNDQVGQETLRDLEADPADEDLRAAVRVQLKKLLKTDPELARRLAVLTGAEIDWDKGAVFFTNIQGNVQTLTNVHIVQGDLIIGGEPRSRE
jgi:hypothetical protein